jgi:putative selenate reductase
VVTTTEATTERLPDLHPYPLDVLLGRIAKEWETRHRIFELPTGRFFHGEPVIDLSVPVFGRTAATPVGPAAGPHTQLAQNFVLGWLAGARTFEMKTVQILDELEIGRPCIDCETIGYNIEWSQELKLEESVREYVKAWMILEILSRWEPLRPHLGVPGPHVFDMSVGYDLAGIQTERVDAFIKGVLDASALIDELRDHIPEPFTEFRDLDYPAQLVDSATLSTFHGCPPDEIEAISKHLMTEYDLDVTVKLNPTLLGHDRVRGILDRLGYADELDPHAFEADLQFDRATELIDELEGFAKARGRVFGIKLSNTLVVRNTKGKMPDDPMYLSGQPLHVITTTLLDRLARAMPGRFRLGSATEGIGVSWSAGIDRNNFVPAVGLGLAPITVCTDLLKPGGYGHFSQMLKRLLHEMEDAGCTNVSEWRRYEHDRAVAAGHEDALAAYVAELTAHGPESPYGALTTGKPLRSVDSELVLWDCVSCNLCVTVCPNDAMLHLHTPEALKGELEQKWQYFCLAELCNDCGNCTTFCPEVGEPFRDKPRLFLTEHWFDPDTGPAFLVKPGMNGELAVVASAGVADEADRMAQILNAPEGLPLRGQDL